MEAVTVPGYAMLGHLGQGGMCDVYKARQDDLDRIVAIKVLHPALCESVEGMTRFLKEAGTGASLNHPHIVRTYEVGEAKGRPFIAVEYVNGVTLHERSEGGLSLAETLRIHVQISAALAYAHACGVIHRDLKPANILVGHDGTAKVADWGIARGVEDEDGLTKTGMVIGTPGYIAPEQITNGTVSAQSDLYSLGVTLFETLARRRLYLATTPCERLRRHLVEEPPALGTIVPTVPPPLATLVNSLLAKRPEDRPASAAEVSKKLQEILRRVEAEPAAPQTVMAPRPTVAKTPFRGKRFFLVVFVCHLIGLPLLYTFFPTDGPPPDSPSALRRLKDLRLVDLDKIGMIGSV